MNPKLKFFHKTLTVICIAGTVGFSVGFTKWFNWNGVTWAQLPVFPNIFDSAFLAFSAVYLGGKNLIKELKNP